MPKRRRRVRSQDNIHAIYEKAMSWFWVLLLVSAVLYFRVLIGDLSGERARFAREREQLYEDTQEFRENQEDFRREFKASVDDAIRRLRDQRLFREAVFDGGDSDTQTSGN